MFGPFWKEKPTARQATFEDLAERIEVLEQQRDALLAACKGMVAWFADPGRGLYDANPAVYLAGSKPIVSAARAAIASVEGVP